MLETIAGICVGQVWYNTHQAQQTKMNGISNDRRTGPDPAADPTDEELDAAMTEKLAEVEKAWRAEFALWRQTEDTGFAVAKVESMYLRASVSIAGCTLATASSWRGSGLNTCTRR
jgi:hypothetical protein